MPMRGWMPRADAVAVTNCDPARRKTQPAPRLAPGSLPGRESSMDQRLCRTGKQSISRRARITLQHGRSGRFDRQPPLPLKIVRPVGAMKAAERFQQTVAKRRVMGDRNVALRVTMTKDFQPFPQGGGGLLIVMLYQKKRH